MSDGKRYAGVQYDTRFGLSYPFTQQMLDLDGRTGTWVTGSEANTGVDQTPRDISAALVKTYDLSAIATARAAYARSYEIPLDVQTPAVLESIGVVFNKSEGESEDSHPATQQDFSVTGNGSGSLNPRSSSKSSAGVQPSIYPKFRRHPQRISGTRYEFFISGNVTEAAIKARIVAIIGSGTVLSWPIFVEVSETIICQGMQVSAGAQADTDISGFVTSDVTGGYAYQWGNGTSKEGSTNNVIVQLPPCIHNTITISPDTDDADATAEATANTMQIDVNGDLIPASGAIVNETGTVTQTATGTVTPSVLFATPVPSVPSSGLYLYDWKIDPSVGFGDALITADVIDALVFA